MSYGMDDRDGKDSRVYDLRHRTAQDGRMIAELAEWELKTLYIDNITLYPLNVGLITERRTLPCVRHSYLLDFQALSYYEVQYTGAFREVSFSQS